MSRRRSRCFGYGEERHECLRAGPAIVRVAESLTACGRWLPGDQVSEPPNLARRRPLGVCPKCWADWMQVCREAARAR